jgi:predicted nucleotidyltransferase
VNRILTVVVGSSAYGLDGPESDYDRRGVFVAPTRPDHIA